jgi:uncharacterized protein YjbI with pentapeptide repeats
MAEKTALTLATEWVRALRGEEREEFNRRAERERPDLENADLRMVDLRGFDLRTANMRGAYLRNADLRGLDLSGVDMHGASIYEARISGTFFPSDIPAEEITLSVWRGTRMRATRS